jgi:hypothetical protein
MQGNTQGTKAEVEDQELIPYDDVRQDFIIVESHLGGFLNMYPIDTVVSIGMMRELGNIYNDDAMVFFPGHSEDKAHVYVTNPYKEYKDDTNNN